MDIILARHAMSTSLIKQFIVEERLCDVLQDDVLWESLLSLTEKLSR